MKLIHIAQIQKPQKGKRYLFLRKNESDSFVWFEENASGQEEELALSASTAEEAIRLARNAFKHHSFRTLLCGFRYNLPERDEHGINALFHQMASSISSPGGVYFEEELGHNCFVQNSSLEAINLLHKLKAENRI